jgi:hypothetical protein
LQPKSDPASPTSDFNPCRMNYQWQCPMAIAMAMPIGPSTLPIGPSTLHTSKRSGSLQPAGFGGKLLPPKSDGFSDFRLRSCRDASPMPMSNGNGNGNANANRPQYAAPAPSSVLTRPAKKPQGRFGLGALCAGRHFRVRALRSGLTGRPAVGPTGRLVSWRALRARGRVGRRAISGRNYGKTQGGPSDAGGQTGR